MYLSKVKNSSQVQHSPYLPSQNKKIERINFSSSQQSWGSWIVEKIKELWNSICKFICCKKNPSSQSLDSVSKEKVSQEKPASSQAITASSSVNKLDSSFSGASQSRKTREHPIQEIENSKQEQEPAHSAAAKLDLQSFSLSSVDKKGLLNLPTFQVREKPSSGDLFTMPELKPTANQRNPIAKLPPDLLMHVFSFLNDIKDTRACVSTCRDLSKSRYKALLQKKAKEAGYVINPYLYDARFLSQIFSPMVRCGMLSSYTRHITFWSSNKENEQKANAEMIQLLKRGFFPNVNSIDLNGMSDDDIQGILKTQGEKLTYLNIYHLNPCSQNVVETIGAHCSNLNHLIVDMNHLSEKQLLEILEQNKGIETLDITHPVLSKEGIKKIGAFLPHLKNIRLIHSASVTDETIKNLAEHCPSLTFVDLCSLPAITLVSVRLLSDCKQQRTVWIDDQYNRGKVTLADTRNLLEEMEKGEIGDQMFFEGRVFKVIFNKPAKAN